MHTSDDQKPFKCSHCPKGFSVLAHLKDHENIHTDSRPHKCKYCDMSFNSIGAKRGHETVMHEGKGPKSRRNASGPRRNRLPGSKSVAGDGAPKKPQKRYPIKYQDCPCEHCGKIFRYCCFKNFMFSCLSIAEIVFSYLSSELPKSWRTTSSTFTHLMTRSHTNAVSATRVLQ